MPLFRVPVPSKWKACGLISEPACLSSSTAALGVISLHLSCIQVSCVLLQVAEAQVLAYPRAMDMVGLADAVAMLAGEPDCQSLCSRRDSFVGLCDSIRAICPPGQSCFLDMAK